MPAPGNVGIGGAKVNHVPKYSSTEQTDCGAALEQVGCHRRMPRVTSEVTSTNYVD